MTMTGSTRAGKAVAKAAGANLKKCVLELGGNDPYLILQDADIELAASECSKSRLLNAGQSCIAAKRMIVHDSIHDEFVETLLSHFQRQVYGDPLETNTTMGPLARKDLREQLDLQVQKSISQGAKVLCGGAVTEGKGFGYQPTIITEVKPESPAFKEELFGPVASVIRVSSEQEAIQLANQSDYGLGSAVFSQNTKRALEIARYELQTGSSFVNDFVKSDVRLPFGGIKQSGLGRELSEFGIHEFVNIKSISIATNS